MTVGQAIQKGFMLSISTWPLAAIIAAFNCVGGLIFLFILGPKPTPDEIGTKLLLMLLAFLIISSAWLYLQGGVLSAVLTKAKTDDPDLPAFFGNCQRFFVRLLALNSLVGIIATLGWVIGAILVGVFVALGGGNNIFFNILAVLFMLVAVFGSLIAIVPFVLAQYVVVIEDGKIGDSIKKSALLAKATWLRLLGLGFLLVLCVGGIALVLNLFIFLLGKIIPPGWGMSIMNVLLSAAINSVLGLFASGTIMNFILSLAQEEPTSGATPATPAM